MEILSADIYATLVHGITGQDLEECVLPAGTPYRVESTLRLDPTAPPRTSILVRDGGQWFRYTTYELGGPAERHTYD